LAPAFGGPGRLAAGRDPDEGRDGFRFFFDAMDGEVTSRFTYHHPHAQCR